MQALLLELNRLGIKLRLEGDELRVNAPQGALTGELRQLLREHKQAILPLLRSSGIAENPLPQLAPDAAGRAEPFALTELQHAYWLGRDSAMEMGSVATHLYVELDGAALDIERLNDALCRMIERHDMLRAVVGGDGMQRILPVVPRYRIAATDVSGASPEAAERAVLAARDALSHQVLQADRWPLFEVRATLLPAARVRLHVSLDLLILDAWSIFLFFKEWHALYDNPHATRPALEISFRDYVLAEQQIQGTPAHQRAHAYWMARVDTLPAAPELPLRADPSARRSPRFSRREARLERPRWERLRAAARARGLTPSGLLLACYAEVLARWSATPHFTLNVTVSNRLPVHEQVNSLLGDFTSLLLQEVDLCDSGATFLERALRLQQQFLADLDHREVSGVSVMREWTRRRGLGLQAAMPVVFSSGLIWSGGEEPGDLEQFGKKVYSISQTSQVWLDHHVMELNGDLVLIWDAADAVFEDGVLDAMFDAYRTLVEGLAGDDTLWDSRDSRARVALPAAMEQRREAASRTQAALPRQRLHAGFVEQAQLQPQAAAVLSPDRSMSYGELLAESAAVADWLLQSGVRAGQPVAVVMRKGWEQVVAVLGTLLAGGAYMPVDADLPAQRRLELLRIGEVEHVLAQPDAVGGELDTGAWRIHAVRAGARGVYGAAHARSLQAPLDEAAYVIFTSGTTGVPKGVVTDHRGAVNTIAHINRMYGVGAQDRVLAVSSLSFDLSVYDIFGLLAAGGALVLPDYRKGHDPVHWRELLARHRVTLWNSAPQLMRMLTDSLAAGEVQEAPLRTVLLSGDFIPLDLPDRLRRHYTGAQVVSLGGATEASIWSIYHPVREVDPAWASIPYGAALPNQTVWVYDQAFRACPDHVKGRIYIGGIGLAIGYWRDAAKTDARFITHPQTGERLYDTGDLGRYAPDGNIVILGRDDGQVKIRGHRVELGEIEAVLRQHPSVRQALVVPTGVSPERRQLAAYAEFHRDCAQPSGIAELRQHMSERLPDYMVPRHVMVIDRIPVSANGKVDLRALPPVPEEEQCAAGSRMLPRTPTERAMFDAWSRVFAGTEMGITDNFFELGGDSVMATHLMRELNAALPVVLEMHELFENLTIESLATAYDAKIAAHSGGAGAASAVLGMAELTLADPVAVQDDVQRAVDGFAALRFDVPAGMRRAQPRAVLLTGATGWIGCHALAELLAQTSAMVYCLVRANDREHARERVLEQLGRCGIAPDAAQLARIEAVCGDLTAPALGLDGVAWQGLAASVDAIHHFGASLNVTANYVTLSRSNVQPLGSIVRLASEHHVKPVYAMSPMTVCRRHLDGQLAVFQEERGQEHPHGLLSAYAQSKWAAEQVLLAAAARGLPVRIYRSSHALPAARTSLHKPNDTYNTVLKVACRVGVVPDWTDSRLPGLPVDVLCRLIVDDTLSPGNHSGIVHVENRDPLNFKDLLTVLLEGKAAPLVSLDEWKARCALHVDGLSHHEEALIKLLFSHRSVGMAVDNMFSGHEFHTRYLDDGHGYAPRLAQLTPPDYWRAVRLHAGWLPVQTG
ncbi:amino acid adenylation domain-containing protein [Pseudoduganella sp. LjRoot289]|uniref:non-ribosomal peptide synthetase n=1 Tax=Pseudoduganella sp. LjRoot289 TaxID=3342314 RepID=UPI003ED12B64